MSVAFNPGQEAVTRNVRLPREMDQELKRLVEAKDSTRSHELRLAIAAHIAIHS